MGSNESIHHARTLESVRLINLLQEEMTREIELREEWQMQVRALYVLAGNPNLLKAQKQEEIKKLVNQLHVFWEKLMQLNPKHLKINEELYYNDSGFKLKFMLNSQSLLEEFVKTIFAYYHRIRGYSINCIQSIQSWLQAFWKELIICAISLGAIVVGEALLFPNVFKHGFYFKVRGTDVHFTPFLLKIAAFGIFCLMFQILTQFKRKRKNNDFGN